MDQPMTWDNDLKMPRLDPKKVPVNMYRLNFQRWLGERGLLEHKVASEPVGEYAGGYLGRK